MTQLLVMAACLPVLLALVGAFLVTAAPSERALRRYFPSKPAARGEVLAGAAATAG